MGMVSKSKGGRPKRKKPSAKLQIRIDADLYARWKKTIGPKWNKRRQEIVSSLLTTWIENCEDFEMDMTGGDNQQLLPRYMSPEDGEKYVESRFFNGRRSRVMDRRAQVFCDGWLIEERVIRAKIPLKGEVLPSAAMEFPILRNLQRMLLQQEETIAGLKALQKKMPGYFSIEEGK